MYKVKVLNACSCFLKSGMAEIQEFETQDEAKKEAESMLSIMKSNFCKKHRFNMNEQFGDFTISITPNR